MARIKRSVHAKKKKRSVFKAAKGFRGARSRLLRTAIEAVDKSRLYAYRDRKVKKRDFRKLWIIRINAAARICGITYSQLIHGLKLSGIELDRKSLADLAMNDFDTFKSIAEQVQAKVAA
ncbi:MAG: large subunit ribosomal protein L20 [bacterium]|jgi:large subunit ribosomal protein L20